MKRTRRGRRPGSKPAQVGRGPRPRACKPLRPRGPGLLWPHLAACGQPGRLSAGRLGGGRLRASSCPARASHLIRHVSLADAAGPSATPGEAPRRSRPRCRQHGEHNTQAGRGQAGFPLRLSSLPALQAQPTEEAQCNSAPPPPRDSGNSFARVLEPLAARSLQRSRQSQLSFCSGFAHGPLGAEEGGYILQTFHLCIAYLFPPRLHAVFPSTVVARLEDVESGAFSNFAGNDQPLIYSSLHFVPR